MYDRNRQMARRNLDKRFEKVRPVWRYLASKQSWIRTISYALGVSGTQLAKRMGVTRQRLSKLEEAEREGAVTLKSLRRAAEALDCRLVYTFIPIRPLEEIVNKRAHEVASREMGRVFQTMALEDQSLPPEDMERMVVEYIQDHISETDLWTDQ